MKNKKTWRYFWRRCWRCRLPERRGRSREGWPTPWSAGEIFCSASLDDTPAVP
ncbi:MAG: hypothetical protein LBC93_04930 [Synergistaceae bacterium]|nr:hypothetical protein [Synergistaceae bacterium]